MRPIQCLGNDDGRPFHSDNHFYDPQTMRPIKRSAMRVSDGTPVDLLKVRCQKMRLEVIAPFPAEARDDEPRMTHDDAKDAVSLAMSFEGFYPVRIVNS